MNKMHKLLIVVATAVMLGGCTYESPEIAQTSPNAAYKYAYSLMESHIHDRVTSIQTILAAEYWASLSTDTERYAFEDAHFLTYKLRDMGNYISLINSNGGTRQITRDSLPITEVGATRQFYNMTLRTIGTNTYEIECITSDCTPEKPYDLFYYTYSAENIRWKVLYKHDFAKSTELINIVEGQGVYHNKGLTLYYQVDAVMCEVSHLIGKHISIFNGDVDVKSSSIVMDAEGTPPDHFTINYSASDNSHMTY